MGLYALPDHEVMEKLLPSIGSRRLSVEDAVERLRRRPGLTPVAINPQGGGAVYFADIGDAPLLEWKHIYTIERLARENAIGEVFSTDLAVLDRAGPVSDGIEPHGLIFHVSRCGSTLFMKALANSRRNLTINQGGPLQEGFWAAITDHWRNAPEASPRNLRMLRNLVLLLTRRRRPEYQRSFVKFISWNVIYLDFIHRAFPTARILYLYRNPVEVIATVLQETTAVLRTKGQPRAASLTGLPPERTVELSDVTYLAHCFAHYFRIVLQAADRCDLHLLDYEHTRDPGCFPAILARGLALQADPAELGLMLQQFRYYSKDDAKSTIYGGEPSDLLNILSAGDRQLIMDVCGVPRAKLDRSQRNLYPRIRTDT
jgi:Sulfotransferase family